MESRLSHGIIRLGFVPLNDCAPIAVAYERGIFERYGLQVRLSRELGWSTVRDKMFYGDLDAAQAVSGIAFSLGLGLTGLKCEVVVPLILNINGNAITLSKELGPEVIGHGEKLRAHLDHHWKKDRPFTVAATHRCSSHHILLHSWLKRHGIHSPDDVEIIFLPPPLMPRHLKAGHIDGFCVGDPWNSEAVLSGCGWCPATSSDLSNGHPEKVLLVSGNFARERRGDLIPLVAALLEACQLCDDPGFRPELIEILSRKEYTGTSPEVLRNSLGPRFDNGSGFTRDMPFIHFHGDAVNRPSVDKASWIIAGLRNTGTFPDSSCGSLTRIYREDLYHAANQLRTHEQFSSVE